jgi:prolyl-tRNA synthetase
MRTRLFLRTTEFLWQEGHTAHVDEADAERETRQMLGVYRRFMEQWMAMPVVTGLKTPSEKFAGALRTYSCEALMQDNRALQAGTSHNLGQNFAKAFDVTFQTAAGGIDHVWNTSWGVSTRLIGGLIMTHGDDQGLICPPLLAQHQVVIVPIWKKDEERELVTAKARALQAELRQAQLRVHVDDRDAMKPGAKYYEWEARGVPFRFEIGPRDLQNGVVTMKRRTGGDKEAIPFEGLAQRMHQEIERMQAFLLDQAKARREANSVRGATKAVLLDKMKGDGGGGFVYGGFCGSAECEAQIKAETKATIRCLPDEEFRSPEAPASCLWCGRPSVAEAVWARAY